MLQELLSCFVTLITVHLDKCFCVSFFFLLLISLNTLRQDKELLILDILVLSFQLRFLLSKCCFRVFQ